MSWLKDLLAKWKVTVAVVGGCLVIATAYGTCTYEPPSDDEDGAEVSAETSQDDAENTTENVSNTESNNNVENTNTETESAQDQTDNNEVKASTNTED